MPRTSWREIEFPITGRDYGFAQEQAAHRFVFKDNQLIESIGRNNPTYRYTIPFREDITGGGWEALFIGVYPDFLSACQDRSRGVLTDPVHGSLPAKCVSLREMLDVNRRDGIDVEAEFIFAPQETDFSNNLGTVIRTLEGAKTYAMRFDAEVAKINWRQQLPPEPTINPLDIPAAFGDQVDAASNQISAAFGDAALRAERSADAIEKLKNPSLEPQRQQARRLKESLLALEEKSDPTGTRPLSKVTTSADRTVSAVAKLLNMPLSQLIKLNPQLARSPVIKAGVQVNVLSESLSKPANGQR